MGVLVYILGRSGTGKSYSMRNFEKDELAVINIQGKIFPFKGAGSIKTINTDDSTEIVEQIKKLSKSYKSIVVDDFQYVMANEFMRRSEEKGWDKFTDIARHAWDIADCVRELPNDVIVYVLCHTDTDQDGFEKLKTIGKMLDEKIVLEGMSTIVLKTHVADSKYSFLTQNNGKDTAKSPAGMFPAYAIDNDLKYVDEKIRNYYELGEFLTDEEMAEIDEAVKHDDIPIKEEPKRRSRSRGKEKEEKPTEAPEKEADAETEAAETEPADKPRRSRRKAEGEAIAEAGTTEDGEPLPFTAETVELPQRRRRNKPTEDQTEEAPEEPTEKAPKRRRRRA